jgi:hypothetical protein
MSLRLAEEMIFRLCARSRANCLDFYTISYIRAHILSVGLSNVRKLACLTSEESYRVLDLYVRDHILSVGLSNVRKLACPTSEESYRVLDLYVRDGHWIGSIFTSYPYDSILLH